MRDIREANKQRISKLETFEENQRQLQQYRELKVKQDIAKREAELHNILDSEAVVQSAKKDLNKLRNVDRPLYDLLLTNNSGFRGDTSRSMIKVGPSVALPVDDDHLIGDIPRLTHNMEESSFLTAD